MRLFGLIGYPLSHSFSKRYFEEKFAKEKITGVAFENFPISDISLLSGLLQENPGLEGIAVTIPYKRSVLSFLDEEDAMVKAIQACNCIRVKGKKLTGFNTDVSGFETSFRTLLGPQHRKALVLGTGGASASVQFALKGMNIPYLVVSRNKAAGNITYGELTEEVMRNHTIVINTTPVGTYPKVNEAPPIPYEFIGPAHYLFDLVYNPAETQFMKEGRRQGALVQNGYAMLVAQAEENWKIWNDENL
jgi:shikimate dehydrogenase